MTPGQTSTRKPGNHQHQNSKQAAGRDQETFETRKPWKPRNAETLETYREPGNPGSQETKRLWKPRNEETLETRKPGSQETLETSKPGNLENLGNQETLETTKPRNQETKKTRKTGNQETRKPSKAGPGNLKASREHREEVIKKRKKSNVHQGFFRLF